MYGNPLNPSTCWITTLAVYFACQPTQPAGPIFPGSNQKARYGQILRQMIAEKEVNMFGTHSVRKGVATFACSGTTGGPSIASVCLRVGWSLGGVQDRYIRYEAAGDQYLGRVVAGLPLDGSEFAALPPHFINNEGQTVCLAVSEMYPLLKLSSCSHDILKLCVASLLYHAEYLQSVMLESHPLFSTFVFRFQSVLNDLKSRLLDGY